MSKVLDSLLKDMIEKIKSPEVHSAIIAPLLAYIMDLLYPYLMVILGLWVLILVGVCSILVFLMYLVS